MELKESCGMDCWRPSFLQRFASNKVFITVFGLLGTLQASSFVYFIATLTTLEKRFQMPSETMGILMSGNEVSQILLVLILSHIGGKGNRPRWISIGVAISAISCFILALPHMIYGAGDFALSLTKEHSDASLTDNTTTAVSPFTCEPNRPEVECSSKSIRDSIVPLVLVFLSQFVLGIGTSLYFSLGQTYMDDNTKKKNTPMLLGVTMALRTLGPACGFILGSLCLRLYVDPSLTPIITRKDPRWLGAWWLGWVLLGSLMFLFAILIGLFPENLPKKKVKLPKKLESIKNNPIYKDESFDMGNNRNSLINEYRNQEKKFANVVIPEVIVDDSFGASLKRVLTNPLLNVNNLTAVFYILGASGYITFYNKYTETQYNASASHANMVAALSTILSLVVGFLLSGFVISKWKPRASYLLIWNIIIGVVYVAGEIGLMSLGCPDSNFQANFTDSGMLNLSAECNTGCACDSVKYSPVCDVSTQTTFFSACHAGCTIMPTIDEKVAFSNCSCVGDKSLVLTQGPCPTACGNSFYLFMFAVCFMQMIGCTGRITNVLINYRSVKQQDKALAQGLALMLISLLAFIPGPIIFGKIIDHACVVWDNTCNKKGNCWRYDKTKFRIYLNTTAGALSSVAVILDIVLYFLGKDLNLYGEENQEIGSDQEQPLKMTRRNQR